ncbi:hypothetical protein SLEP1_g10553 [Rubroshorea leprosula]|uniref:RRM domain-containing protein n=1 Tax=Rubroshorea leprosula TaxID=152421 RepID=A0AAV5IJS8_9ROSI|nr:hypothetical protein SLEP1_g10553 [Rubroshorea leprosula]
MGTDLEKAPPSQLTIVSVQAVGGIIAGATASCVTTPLDTVKTRLLVMGHEKRPSTMQVVKTLIADNGWKGLYRGLGPRFFSMSAWGTSMILAYEYLKWTFEHMWRTFKKFGRVLDIYYLNRKGKDGRRFGFVRFQGVADEIALESQLDMIVVDGLKLRVNRRRFSKSRRNMPLEIEKKTTIIRNERDRRSFTEVVGGASIPGEKESTRGGPSTVGKMGKREWKAKQDGKGWSGLEFVVEEEEYTWLKGCYVGEVHAVEMIKVAEEETKNGLFPLKLDFQRAYPQVNPNEDEDAWSWDSELGELQRDECFQIQEDVGKDVDETTCRNSVKEKLFAFQNFENFQKRGDVEEKEASINEGGDGSRLLQEIEGREGLMEMVGDSLHAAQEKQSHKCVMFCKEVSVAKKESMVGEIYGGSNGSFGMGVVAQMDNPLDCSSSTNGHMKENKEGPMEDTNLQKTLAETQEQLKPNRAMESDDGQTEEQRGRREKESRNGKRRVKSCAEVCFEPNLEKEVADDSIEDSGIRNCNRKGGHKEDFRCAKEMWLLVKELGVKTKGDEEGLVRRIARLEEMDKARRKKTPKQKALLGKQVDPIPP